MLSPKRVNLLLATILAASSLVFVVASYSVSDVSAESKVSKPTLRSRILRRKDRLKLKLNADEIALLRKQGSQEERELEDRIPKHLPIKVKIRTEKEKAFKNLENSAWLRDLEIEIRNTGNKPIYFLLVALHLPESPIGESHEVISLGYGRSALSKFEEKILPDDVPIRPNETYILRVPEKLAVAWQRHRNETGSPRITKLWLSFHLLNFGDGTGFHGTTGAS